MQKSKFGGLNVEPRSPKIALRSSLGVTFVEQDRPRASKSVTRASQATKKSRRRRPRQRQDGSRGQVGPVRGQSTGSPYSGPAECAVPAEGGGGKPPGFSEEFGGVRRMFAESSPGRRQGAADSNAPRIPPRDNQRLRDLEAWRLRS